MKIKTTGKKFVNGLCSMFGAYEGTGASVIKRVVFYTKYCKEMTNCVHEYLAYEPTAKQIRWLRRDYLVFLWKYGGSLDVDYFHSMIFRKSKFTRMESLANKDRFQWRKKLQDSKYCNIFKDKREFYKAFTEFLNRPWMLVNQDTTEKEFWEFVHSCDHCIFVKDPLGYGGKSVTKHLVSDWEASATLLRKLKSDGIEYVAEGQIHQCEEIFSFSNSSVNTFRILTLVDEAGNPHIANALLRIGNGHSHVDNFSSGGIAAPIDIDTGVISGAAMDAKTKEYLFHPVTGKQIIGYKIPGWEAYKDFALNCARRFPTVRYVGWDIIKTDTGKMCVIEGNDSAGFDVQECRLMYGLRPVYEKILNQK